MRWFVVLALVLFAACQRPLGEIPSDQKTVATLINRTVHVECPDGGWGSGVILGSRYRNFAHGTLIVTAAHVADETCKQPSIRGVAFETVARDADTDVALLFGPLLADMPEVQLADYYLGEPCIAVGYPNQYRTPGTAALQVSRGAVMVRFATLFRFSAPISPGSSGGGLWDEHGRLLGLTTQADPIGLYNGVRITPDAAYYATPATNIAALLKTL